MTFDIDLEDATKLNKLAEGVANLACKDEDLAQFCSEATLKRYLAARRGNVAAAVKMLRKTLEWRQSYRPQDITFQEVKALASTGRLEVLEQRDLAGRPVLCYRLSRKNVGGLDPEQHLRFMLFNLEAASKKADDNGAGKMTWLMDMDNFDQSQSVPIMTTKKITSILQNHYPERLGIILIMRANSMFQALYYVVKGFLDPVTRAKLHFLNDSDDAAMQAKLLQYVSQDLLVAALSCRKADAPFDLSAYEARMS